MGCGREWYKRKMTTGAQRNMLYSFSETRSSMKPLLGQIQSLRNAFQIIRGIKPTLWVINVLLRLNALWQTSHLYFLTVGGFWWTISGTGGTTADLKCNQIDNLSLSTQSSSMLLYFSKFKMKNFPSVGSQPLGVPANGQNMNTYEIWYLKVRNGPREKINH